MIVLLLSLCYFHGGSDCYPILAVKIEGLYEMKVKQASQVLRGMVVLLIVISAPACSGKDYQAFLKSHESVHPNMTMREVFDAGLANYLSRMGVKSVPGVTLPERQPASPDCARHVLDISHFESFPWSSGRFWIRVYCGTNEPTAKELVPTRSFTRKEEFLGALDTYDSWVRSMNFLVQSPPLQL
jgi:hypothetical protein